MILRLTSDIAQFMRLVIVNRFPSPAVNKLMYCIAVSVPLKQYKISNFLSVVEFCCVVFHIGHIHLICSEKAVSI